ncbi:MAG: hypothetical protein RJA09_652, partial [Pseudomonadota bacterium]
TTGHNNMAPELRATVNNIQLSIKNVTFNLSRQPVF